MSLGVKLRARRGDGKKMARRSVRRAPASTRLPGGEKCRIMGAGGFGQGTEVRAGAKECRGPMEPHDMILERSRAP